MGRFRLAIKLDFNDSQKLFIAYLEADAKIKKAGDDIRYLFEAVSALELRTQCMALFQACEVDDTFAMEYAELLFQHYGKIPLIVYNMASTETKVFLKMKYGDNFS